MAAAILGTLILLAGAAAGAWWWMGRALFQPGTVTQVLTARGETLEVPPGQRADASSWQVTGDVQLHHVAVGEGRDVLVIHGGPGLPPANPWRAAALTRDALRWHFYDQRGSGASSRPITLPPPGGTWRAMQEVEARLGLAAQLADVERIRRLLGRERLTLVGHSFGALIALLYAAEWPERVDALVLVAPAPLVTMPSKGDDLFTQVRTRLDEAAQRELAAWMKHTFDFPARLKDDEARLAEHFAAFGPLYARALNAERPDTRPPDTGAAGGFLSLGLYLSLGRHHDWSEWLRRVRARTLVIHGAHDLQPRSATTRVVEAIPHARLVELAGSGHFPFEEQPEAFAATVRAFLQEEER
ncbi:alpha/beta hydrolase [Myxococcus sp. MISCRS1]|jgi:proline iminopeptidase|uniref:alpha/beta fold hydrolase n=1 Tax=Myxococcus TaxID=32 RepID=UPI002271C87B|nr:alpha/beta hydrolase [Myxococcus sp. MISCRS1]MCY0997477.1 alpha/beta hydrolase [Myxococcus sp. MISCRS1]BDT32511.1 alpha/beta hydrolase [Myxococcus sp. MH1]